MKRAKRAEWALLAASLAGYVCLLLAAFFPQIGGGVFLRFAGAAGALCSVVLAIRRLP